MHSRGVHVEKLGRVTIRPLSNGDVETVATVATVFNRASSAELARLATVDLRRHTLVAYVEGDPQPAGIAQLARDPNRSTEAEVALAVASRYHGESIGSILLELLGADARAAGITNLTAAKPCVDALRMLEAA